jgi:transposase
MPQVDIITGADRHRRWSLDEKLSILAAAFAPGAVTAHIAKRMNVSTSQLYTWRKELMPQYTHHRGFSQVVVGEGATRVLPPPTPEPTPMAAPCQACELPAIEFEVRGSKVRIPDSTPPTLAAAVVRALVRR